MELEWYIVVGYADLWGEYEHCPVYLIGELILSTDTKPFIKGQKINQFFTFYRKDWPATHEAEETERIRAAEALEEAKEVEPLTLFSEYANVTGIYPGLGKIFD